MFFSTHSAWLGSGSGSGSGPGPVRVRVRVRVRIRVLTCVDSVPETVLGRPRLAASMGHSAE